MVNNLNIKMFPFFDSVKNPAIPTGTSDSFKNNGYENLTIEVSGEGSAAFSVEGCMNIQKPDGSAMEDEECSWTSLAIFNGTDLSQLSEISEKGIYYVSIAGLSRVRVNVSSASGNVTILGLAGK